MRITIRVDGEHLGDVEVERVDHSGRLDGRDAEHRLARLMTAAVNQALAAYGLTDKPNLPLIRESAKEEV